MRTRPIVVGTDGTECSAAAVDWAVDEARRRRLPLRIVHAFEWSWQELRYDGSADFYDVSRSFAESIAAAAYHRAHELAPELVVQTDVPLGHAAAMMLAASDDAELVVLGSRGRGGFAGLLLGSVSQRVATHAAGPVVVVRGRRAPDAPVVVGVDDSPAADHVLETAFDEASSRDCALVVVRSFLPVIPLGLDKHPVDVPTPEQDDAELHRLGEQLAPWRGKYPDVPVEIVLSHNSAAAALVDASKRARLVIVGGQGRGAIRGALLGSTGLQLLHHADCPVMITRPRRTRTA